MDATVAKINCYGRVRTLKEKKNEQINSKNSIIIIIINQINSIYTHSLRRAVVR